MSSLINQKISSIWAYINTFAAFFFATTTAQSVPSANFVYDAGVNGNLTIAVNVPSNNTNDDLFFRVTAPFSGSWYGFGFGEQMAGSLIFVMYPSGDDQNNVTVSPRLGTGHEEPQYTSAVEVTVLAGSGLTTDSSGNENMILNAKCIHCRSWSSGQIDITSNKQPMIYAAGPSDDTINSNSLTETIQQHAGHGQFTMDLVTATGAGGVPSDSTSQSGVDQLNNEADGGGPGGALHALFMCGTFIVLFPAGYLFLRLFERMWIHIAFQSFGLFVFLLGAASGIALSIRQNKVWHS